MDCSSSLHAASNGFYFQTCNFDLSEDAKNPETITYYDRDGQQRFSKTFSDHINIYNLIPLEDGTLVVGFQSTSGVNGVGMCMRLDSEGRELWKTTADNPEFSEIFIDAVALDDGGFLVLGCSSSWRALYTYDITDGGDLNWRRFPVSVNYSEPHYSILDNLIRSDENLVALQTTYSDPEHARVSIMDPKGHPIRRIHLFAEDTTKTSFFLSNLLDRNGELYFAHNDYFSTEKPLVLFPLNESQRWEELD